MVSLKDFGVKKKLEIIFKSFYKILKKNGLQRENLLIFRILKQKRRKKYENI